MKQEDKDLLLRDLCARLPYGVKCSPFNDNHAYTLLGIDDGVLHLDCPVYDEGDGYVEFDYCKPYLRPMSSMTEEEEKEYINIDNLSYSCPMAYAHVPASDRIDWLNKNHFDYRGLIEKGLAIEAPEDMYKI